MKLGEIGRYYTNVINIIHIYELKLINDIGKKYIIIYQNIREVSSNLL